MKKTRGTENRSSRLYDWACKPGSVVDSHLSRRTVAGTLQPPSRGRPGQPDVLSAVLLRIEFTASRGSPVTGELLPRLSTLTPSTQAPARSLHRKRQSSVPFAASPFPLRTAALGSQRRKGNGAVSLCCTFPEVALGGRYPLCLPCGARTFLTIGLSALIARLSSSVALLF